MVTGINVALAHIVKFNNRILGLKREMQYRAFLRRFWECNQRDGFPIQLREFSQVLEMIDCGQRLRQNEMNRPYSILSVDAAGNWTASFSAFEIPDGTYTTTAQISTEDRAGNTATTSKTFQVDTEVVPLTSTSQPGGNDGVVGEAEAAQGFTLTGQVEQGSTVMVTIAGQQMP